MIRISKKILTNMSLFPFKGGLVRALNGNFPSFLIFLTTSISGDILIMFNARALWMMKKQEERDVLFKDIEELRELARWKMFGR